MPYYTSNRSSAGLVETWLTYRFLDKLVAPLVGFLFRLLVLILISPVFWLLAKTLSFIGRLGLVVWRELVFPGAKWVFREAVAGVDDRLTERFGISLWDNRLAYFLFVLLFSAWTTIFLLAVSLSMYLVYHFLILLMTQGSLDPRLVLVVIISACSLFWGFVASTVADEEDGSFSELATLFGTYH